MPNKEPKFEIFIDDRRNNRSRFRVGLQDLFVSVGHNRISDTIADIGIIKTLALVAPITFEKKGRMADFHELQEGDVEWINAMCIHVVENPEQYTQFENDFVNGPRGVIYKMANFVSNPLFSLEQWNVLIDMKEKWLRIR